MSIKDYLGVENARNKANAKLYEALIKAAFGQHNDVLVGHHLTFEQHGDIDTENEIPAADTLIFDHLLMQAVFGDEAMRIMTACAQMPADGGGRERLVERELAEARKAKSGRHKHKCPNGRCGRIWEHADSMKSDFNAHQCPGCGTEQFWKHHG